MFKNKHCTTKITKRKRKYSFGPFHLLLSIITTLVQNPSEFKLQAQGIIIAMIATCTSIEIYFISVHKFFTFKIRELECRNNNNSIVYLLVLYLRIGMESEGLPKLRTRNENSILMESENKIIIL